MALFDLFRKKKANTKKAESPTVQAEKAAVKKTSTPDVTEKVTESTKTTETKPASKSKATAKTNPEPVAAVKAKSTSKVAEKYVTKAAPKAEAKPVQKAAEKPASKAAPKAEAKPVQKAAEKPASKAAPKAEAKPDSVAAATAEIPSDSYTGTFEINKSKDGKKFFFNLYATNKVGIASSQMYSTSQSALNGVKSVIANAATAPIEDQSLKKYDALPYPKWEIYIDNGGKYRFRLNASNGNCVCHSQGYTTKNACKNGIDSIIRSSRNAQIIKTYIDK